MSEVKQVIVLRHDLNYGTLGKKLAQASHASIAFLTKRLKHTASYSVINLSEAEKLWIEGSFAKVVLRVDSEEQLLAIHYLAQEAGLVSHLITDKGLTVFKEPTNTAVGIGPDYSSKIDLITKDLKLL